MGSCQPSTKGEAAQASSAHGTLLVHHFHAHHSVTSRHRHRFQSVITAALSQIQSSVSIVTPVLQPSRHHRYCTAVSVLYSNTLLYNSLRISLQRQRYPSMHGRTELLIWVDDMNDTPQHMVVGSCVVLCCVCKYFLGLVSFLPFLQSCIQNLL